jgi:hypothetical protein
MSTPILYLGLDVHKDSVTVAVFGLRRIRRFLQRPSNDGEQLRACNEASGAGCVLQRQLSGWGYHRDVCAPSLIPTPPGERRTHDERDAARKNRPIAATAAARELVRFLWAVLRDVEAVETSQPQAA